MSAGLALVAVALALLAGTLGAALEPKRASRAFAAGMVASGVAGASAAGLALAGRGGAALGGAVALDALGGLFLVPIALVPALSAVFGVSYWHDGEGTGPGRRLRLFFGVAVAGLVVVVLARHSLVFLVAWELMALAAFFLVATEDGDAETRRASWIYLASTHLATLALAGLFAHLRSATGTFRLESLPAGFAATAGGTVLFWLALAGFGLKAGLFPLHVWLPPAHAAAPSHVSAILSGVVLKIGVYGLVRFLSLVPDPPAWWGGTLLALGAASALLGVLLALGQHDLKRLLAYHSVENVGIIFLGVGLGTLGRARGEAAWVVLGLSGGLLHVVNHAFFKSLLFLAAGNVVRATGTREIDRLGGLSRRMPATAAAFAAGAAAICGLPPLNGFVSEWLVYLGLAGAGTGARVADAALAVLAAASLALVGGLAVACFVKAFGAVFLGSAREEAGASATDGDAFLTVPMAILALLCLAIGLVPAALARPLDRAVAAAASGAWGTLAAGAPIGALTAFALLAAVLLAAGAAVVWRLRDPQVDRGGVTWDCGYAAPTSRMQYTASSFADTLVRAFRFVLRPRRHRPPAEGATPEEGAALFPAPARFASHVPDVVLDEAVTPALGLAGSVAERARFLQSGHAQAYVVYVFVTLLLLLVYAS